MKKKLNYSITTIVILALTATIITSCEKEEVNNDIITAGFTTNKTTIDQGDAVKFTDQSTMTPNNWSWDFGDGTTSNEQNPSHIYSSHGLMSVSLTVSNNESSDTETKTDYITVIEKEQTVTDIDGNIYNTVVIGSQIWMAENLKVTHFPDGSELQYITDDYEWNLLEDNNFDKAYCYYNNNLEGEADIYGALYTWAAAMNGTDASDQNPSGVQGICPDGWHIPSSDEWWTLINGLGGKTIAGGKLKESGTTHWDFNDGATNESGFTALPGGYRNGSGGSFYTLGNFGYWWSASEEYSSNGWSYVMYHMNSQIDSEGQFKSSGKSIRCVKN